MPAVSVVIVTWNEQELLRRCVMRLGAALDGLSAEAIIIDNASTDGTRAWLGDGTSIAGAPCPVSVRFNARNLGVARARNQGIRAARGRYVCLLDADTEPAPRALTVLVQFLDTNPAVALAAPRLVGLDGRLQYSCRRLPTLPSKLARRLPPRLSPRLQRLLDETELRGWDHGSSRAVDYAIGACQMIRRAALDEVGLLDERIFYGPEDVDLCLRLWHRGWEVVYVPEAVVTHHERRVTRQFFSWLSVRHALSLAYYFAKHRYVFRAPLIRPWAEVQRGAAGRSPTGSEVRTPETP